MKKYIIIIILSIQPCVEHELEEVQDFPTFTPTIECTVCRKEWNPPGTVWLTYSKHTDTYKKAKKRLDEYNSQVEKLKQQKAKGYDF